MVFIMNKNKEKINKIVETAKYDVIFCIFISIICSIIFLIMFLHWKTFIPLFYNIIPLFLLETKVHVYLNIISIKKYIEKNKLCDKMGNILFYNEEYYLLTDIILL